jgi:hypothetical protein
MALDFAGQMLISLVLVAITFPWASQFVVLATAIIKRFLPETISANAISFAINAALWIIVTVLLHFTSITQDQIQNWVNILATILTAVGGVAATALAATKSYQVYRNQGVPVFGFSRSKPAAAPEKFIRVSNGG